MMTDSNMTCKDPISKYITHSVDYEKKSIRTTCNIRLQTEFFYTDDINEQIEEAHDAHVKAQLKAWFEEVDWDA